jgi:tRNA U34 2-thiouridine synthase MnmA/TrmU
MQILLVSEKKQHWFLESLRQITFPIQHLQREPEIRDFSRKKKMKPAIAYI